MADSKQHLKRPRVTILEIFVILLFLFISFRLLAIAALLVAAALYALYPLHHRKHWLMIASIAYFVASASPIDIALASYPGEHYHNTRNGPRLVKCVTGCMTAHASCRQKYGEYITRDWNAPNPPGWVLVLH